MLHNMLRIHTLFPYIIRLPTCLAASLLLRRLFNFSPQIMYTCFHCNKRKEQIILLACLFKCALSVLCYIKKKLVAYILAQEIHTTN